MADLLEGLSLVLIIVIIILAFGLSFAIGGNDETSAPLAAAGTLSFKSVLVIGGLGLAIGTIFFSEAVADTVGSGLLGEGITYTIYILLAVLISSIVWLVVGSFAGIPLSSTHALVGSIFGVVIVFSLFRGGIDPATALNWEKLGGVVISWFISPLAGLIVTFLIYRFIAKLILQKKKGLNTIEVSESKFIWALVVAVFFASIWTGANSAEALGMIYALYDNGTIAVADYYFLVVICGVFAFLGVFLAGRFVIKNLASQMSDTRPSDGFIIQAASAIILMFCTVLFKVPISHSHVIVFCIIGMNVAQKKEVNYSGLGKMALFWVLTFPMAAVLAGFIYYGFNLFGLF
jgi:PiT family inorganic phosphate transporter